MATTAIDLPPLSHESMSRHISSSLRGLSEAAASLRLSSATTQRSFPSRYCLDTISANHHHHHHHHHHGFSTSASLHPSLLSPSSRQSRQLIQSIPILPLSSNTCIDHARLSRYTAAPGAGPSYTKRAMSDDAKDDSDQASDSSSSVVNPTPKKAFKYEISASYSAKQRRWEPANTFVYNPYNRIPYESDWQTRKKARPKTGQDAFFVSRVKDTGAVAFGVADGVGGYSDSGIDSADFSHPFCEEMAEVAHSADTPLSAGRLLIDGYNRLTLNKDVPGGASTACIGVATPEGELEVANLGDSGYVLLRCGRVHFASNPQTHAFNTPFQLSIIPQFLIDQAVKYGGGVPFSDGPEEADIERHTLQNGDVLIFATDGLWDNLSAQEVLRLVSEEMVNAKGWVVTENGFVPGVNLASVAGDGASGLQAVIARAVASRAKTMSLNQKVDGPFAKEVQRVYPGEVYHGGKRDDICVICVIALETSPQDIFIKGGLPGETNGRNGLPGGGGPGAPMPKL